MCKLSHDGSFLEQLSLLWLILEDLDCHFNLTRSQPDALLYLTELSLTQITLEAKNIQIADLDCTHCCPQHTADILQIFLYIILLFPHSHNGFSGYFTVFPLPKMVIEIFNFIWWLPEFFSSCILHFIVSFNKCCFPSFFQGALPFFHWWKLLHFH